MPEVEEKPSEAKISFPKVDGPTAFYDDAEHVAWIAVPFDKVFDPNFVMAAVDRSKFDILNFLGKYAQDRIRREAIASKTKANPSIFAKLGLK